MSNQYPDEYPDQNSGSSLTPDGVFPEIGKAFNRFGSRKRSDVVNQPRGALHGKGIIEHTTEREMSGATAQAYDTDEINASTNIEAILARAAGTLGRKLTRSEENTVREIGRLISTHLPAAQALASQLSGQLFDGESSGATVVNQIMQGLDVVVTGPAGSTTTLLNPMTRVTTPVMGADSADVTTREFIATAYAPNSNGKATGKMSTSEMAEFIGGEVAQGRNPFAVKSGNAEQIIKSTEGNVISSDAFGRIAAAESRRIAAKNDSQTKYETALDKAVYDNSQGKSSADKEKLRNYAVSTKTRTNLQETIAKIGIKENLNSVESIANARTAVQQQIKETTGKDPSSKKRRAQLIAIDKRLGNQESTHKKALSVKGMTQEGLDKIQKDTAVNNHMQLREFYSKAGGTEEEVSAAVHIQKRMQVLKRAGLDYDNLRGEENAEFRAAILKDPNTSKEVKDALGYVETHQKELETRDRLMESVSKNQAGEKITRYEDLIRKGRDNWSDADKEEMASLEHEAVIRDYTATVNAGENNKSLMNKAQDFQVFRKALRSSSPDVNADDIRQVNAVLEDITKGSLNVMSDESRSKNIQELSTLMSEQGAGVSVAIEASNIGAEVARSLGENGAEAGTLAAKAGLVAYNEAVRNGKTGMSAVSAARKAAERAGKASNSAVAKGLGGLQSYLRKNKDALNNVADPKTKAILTKIANKETLTAEESDFIGGSGNLSRIMKAAGASDSDVVRMFNATARREDKEYADSMAYQANAKNTKGLWAARDTMGVLASGSKNEAIKGALTGDKGTENQKKLMDTLFENPEIAQNPEAAKAVLMEKFKDNPEMLKAIQSEEGLSELQDIMREGGEQYRLETGDETFEAAAQTVNDAQNYGENADRARRSAILEKQSPSSYSSMIAHTVDTFLSNPNASATELAGKIMGGEFDLSGEQDKQKAAKLVTAHLLNSDAEKVNGLLGGQLDKDRFEQAQATIKKIDNAGMYDKYSKYANGEMNVEEKRAFEEELFNTLGGDDAAAEEIGVLADVNNDISEKMYEKLNTSTAKKDIAINSQVDAVEKAGESKESSSKTEQVNNEASETAVRVKHQEAMPEADYAASGGSPSVTGPSAQAIAEEMSQKVLKVQIVEVSQSAAQKISY